ncbi:sulfatase [Rhodopirellula sp. JC639]|uniref:sulfatase n=1 Tax=Stieleria mannarensis TaxID=2755585 RepID=UPI0016024B6E
MRPNIIVILADDLGYGDLGCYGSEIHQTPNIDALSASGLRFTDFHSAGAMCSPTRASLLTGSYPQRFGKIFDGALSGTTQRDLGLPQEATTISERLKQNGYATACFGKWHLGYRSPLLPTRQGFDVFRGLVSGDGDFHTQVDRSGNNDWWHNESLVREDGYTTDLLTDHSIDFIEAHRDRPFFIYLAHLAIHFPWQGPNDPPHRQAGTAYHRDKWGVIPDPQNVAPHVKAMVESLDESVGRLIRTLRARGLEKKTLVVFTSDNGGYLTYGKRFKNISSNGRYRGQKMDLYEGGHRVPMIVSWPGHIAPRVCDQTTHSNDLFPTLLALSGDTSDNGAKTDGVNLVPLWLENKPPPPRVLCWRTFTHGATRSGPWKLVRPLRNGGKAELYHLESDPDEQHNLAGSKPEQVRQLRQAWAAWDTDVNASARRHQP